MAFSLTPGKLGFKLNDVLVGLKSGTTDTPETITSDQGRMHTLGYVWNPSTLAYELPTVSADGGLLVSVSNFGAVPPALRVDDDGAGTLYVGEAEPCSAETDPVWRYNNCNFIDDRQRYRVNKLQRNKPLGYLRNDSHRSR